MTKRLFAAARAAALGLLAGVAVLAVIGTARVLLASGLEVTSPVGLLVGPIMILAEGMLWGLMGGGMLVFPLAVAAFAFKPPNTHVAAVAISALLLAPVFVVRFPGAIDALSLLFATWIGVRVGLRVLCGPMDGR